MQSFTQPAPLQLTGNLAENWRKWVQRLRLYLSASGLDGRAEDRKIAVLLHCIGEDALEIYNTLDITYADDENKTMEEVLTAFEKYCAPRKNTVFERHQFWTHQFSEHTTIDKFVTELRQKARTCEFKQSEDLMIRDKIVFSMSDTRLREKLLATPELSLTAAIDICRAKEIVTAQSKLMSGGLLEQAVLAVEQRQRQTPPPKARAVRAAVERSCDRCGKSHRPRNCPAFNVECRKCGKKNHFAAVCRSAAEVAPVDTESIGVDALFIGAIGRARARPKDTGWRTALRLGGQTVTFKLDTGAEANVLPQSVANSLTTAGEMRKTDTVLVAYGGSRIKPKGILTFQVHSKDRQAHLQFYVTDSSDTPILGREACVQLNLVKKIHTMTQQAPPRTKTELLQRYASVFKGLGQFPGEHHIHVDPQVPPVVHGCRKIPFAVLDRLKETLDIQEQRGVCRKVTKPTPWVSSLVITEKKNGSLRVCLDPRDLNRAVLRQHYSIPTPEDVQCRLAGMQFFTILDEKDGYWQIKLDDESADLCTFNTPWGRYQFTRLPFGIKSASEVFQRINTESFGDIAGVHIIADDMIIAAATKEEHDQTLQQVMDRAAKLNIKFNADKIQYMVSEVTYMGHIISAHGVRADESKIVAITQMAQPADKKGLQRLLGMTRFLAQYIPHEATLTAPLRQLLRKDIVWQWQPEHQAALDRLKAAISAAPQLKFFSPREEIEIQADASKDGLGAVLMQAQRPVAFASRALSAAEQNYAQIEKELLAIVFAFRKFHQYVYGVTVKVQSDHKPLEAIITKPIGRAPARLQRMLLQLQKYDMRIVYTPGKDMLVADALSRAALPTPPTEHSVLGDEKVVYDIRPHEPLGGPLTEQLRAATASDSDMQTLMRLHKEGWPARQKSLPLAAQPYWHARNDIYIEDGLLMIDLRMIIPRGFRTEMLRRLHTAHQGIQRSLAHARALMYWPGLTADVTRMVESCLVCQEKLPDNQKEPLLPHAVPDTPWAKIAADIFEFQGRSLLLVVDYFSKYPEVLHLSNKTSGVVIAKFKGVFARHGIPNELIADHVPFASAEMARFAKEWGFTITHSSPAFPQSNGLAERTIQSVKNMLKATSQTGIDPHLALLHLRNTPITGLKYSPAQLLMGRVLRSDLPVSKKRLLPVTPENVQECLVQRQLQQKATYDKAASPLAPFEVGGRVCMKTNKGWQPATVQRVRDEPRSYDIVTPDGAQYRRNRRHLRPDRVALHTDTDHTTGSASDADQESEQEHNEDVSVSLQDPGPVPNPEPSTAHTSRSGRSLRLPSKLKDYVLEQ